MTFARAFPRTDGFSPMRTGSATGGELSGRWDRIGAWASAACAVHCLVAPLLFLLAPAFAGVWAHPSSHVLIATLVLPLAGTVLLRGYRLHGRGWVAAAAAVGAGCILTGCVLPFLGGGASSGEAGACMDCCPQIVTDDAGATTIGWPAASVVTILGSLFLVASHLGNHLYCRCCNVGAST